MTTRTLCGFAAGLLWLGAPGCPPTGTCAGAEAAPPRCEAVRLEREPVLDGIIEGDPGWEKAGAGGGHFTDARTGKVEGARQTSFLLGYTAEGLFLGVTCREPEPDRIRAEAPDMGNLWEEDSVEVFLVPAGREEYFQVIVSGIGSRYNGTSRGSEPLGDWQAATFMGDESWSLELMVPFEVVAALPEPGKDWKLNVCRNVRTTPEPLGLSWSPVEGRFSNTARFGTLAFQAGLSEAERKGLAAKLARPPAAAEAFVYCTDEMFVVKGENKELLLRIGGEHVAPRLHPDCTQVLYNSMAGNTAGVWRVDVATKARSRLCDGDQVSCAADGKRILLRRAGRIVERHLETGQERVVTPEGWTNCAFPSLMPDGRALFVAQGRPDRLCLAGAAGSAPKELANGVMASPPQGSPDGSRIAFQDGAHIWRLDVATGQRTQLTAAGGIQARPVWAADGKSLCYSQMYDTFRGVGDVYHMASDRPEEVRLVLASARWNMDWKGVAPKGSKPAKLPKSGLRFAEPTAPEFPLKPEGLADGALEWKAPPVQSGAVAGELVLDNGLAALQVSPARGKMALLARVPGGQLAVLELCPLDAAGRPFAAIKAASLRGGQPAGLELGLAGSDGKPMAASLRLAAHRPAVEFVPGANVSGLAVVRAFRYVVVPDRSGNDIVPDPAASAARVALPWGAVTLGFPESEDFLVVLATPSRRQTVETRKNGSGFAGFSVGCAGSGVTLGVVTGRACWRDLAASSMPENKGYAVAWENPFHAQWRATARWPDGTLSLFQDVRASVKEVAVARERLDGAMPEGAPGKVLLYPYARNAMTPLDQLTVTDVLQDALGPAAADELLDSRGLRDCRLGDEWMPFKEPRVVFLVLGWFCGASGRKGLVESVGQYGKDLANMAAGLDRRADEYERFFDEAGRVCAALRAPGPEAARALECIAQQLAARKVAGRPAPSVSLDALRAAADKLAGRAGKSAWEMDGTKEYKEFKKLGEAALDERAKLVKEQRRCAMRIRDLAGQAILAGPELRPAGETLREAAGKTLRNRCFLEAGWRGERQLSPEVVDYEKASKIE